MIGHRPPEWTKQAECIGMTARDWDPWAPDDTLPAESVAYNHFLARSICSRCPVRLACLRDALEDLPRRDTHAVRGGLTPDEQIQLARRLGMRWRREAQHGTRSRYVAGCKCSDCREAHRVYEHERRLWARARTTVVYVITVPWGRGRRAVGPGQGVLFTDGLPEASYQREDTAA